MATTEATLVALDKINDTWVWGFLGVVLGICVLALIFTFWLFRWVMNHSEGPDAVCSK